MDSLQYYCYSALTYNTHMDILYSKIRARRDEVFEYNMSVGYSRSSRGVAIVIFCGIDQDSLRM